MHLHYVPTLLIVEDHPETMQLYRDALGRSHAYSLIGASNEDEALAYLKGIHFDLILLDLRLPKGSGQTLLQYIRAHPKHGDTKILVVTADTRSVVTGADALLHKPFSVDALWNCIDRLLAVCPPPASGGAYRPGLDDG